MKVALVHDYFVNRGGAERVVAAMHRVWPEAPIFTSLYFPDATYDAFRSADIRVSGLQRLCKNPEGFRRFLPLFPRAFRRMDLRGYDVVISSSSGFAHHVRPPAGTCHIVYSYSPPRFLWDESYGLDGIAPAWARPVIPAARAWLRQKDKGAAARTHATLAVSAIAARRILRVYGRSATVLYPPVSVDRFAIAPTTGDYWLLVGGRMLPYRNQSLAMAAFREMDRPLVVVGDGPSRESLERAKGARTEFRGVVSEEELTTLYARCRGVIVPGIEDLGLIALEANASGRPAVALAAGGALETIVDGVTGVLFPTPSVAAVTAAVERAEATTFDPVALRAHAETFSEAAFARGLREFVVSARASCITCARARGPGAP